METLDTEKQSGEQWFNSRDLRKSNPEWQDKKPEGSWEADKFTKLCLQKAPHW